MITHPSQLIRGFALLALLTAACGRAAAPAEEHDEHEEAGHEEHAGEVHVDPEIAAQQGIRVERAAPRFLPPLLTVPARVALSQDGLARVVSPVEGRIVEILVQTGDEVAEGDLLAVLDSPAFAAAQRDFISAARQEAAARGPEVLARESWQRAQDLHAASGDPPRSEVQRREAEVLRLEAERIEAESRRAAAEEWLLGMGLTKSELADLLTTTQPRARFELRSPRKGRVIERATAVGQFAGPDHDAVAAVADLEALWVLASFPESRLHELHLGAQATIFLDSQPDHSCPGEVSFISPVLDLATRTVELRIQPEDRHPDLRPGLFARAEIELLASGNPPTETVAVPESAVLRIDGASTIFVPVAGEPGVYAPRAVRAGRSVRGWVPILEGLQSGEEYVAAGGFLLKAELEKGEAGHDH